MKASDRHYQPVIDGSVTEAELGELPQQMRIAFAARSALRVLPLLEGGIDTWGKDANTTIQALSALVYWPVIASLDFKFAASHSTVRLENAAMIAAGLVEESPAVECIATLGNAVLTAFLKGTDVELRDLPVHAGRFGGVRATRPHASGRASRSPLFHTTRVGGD